jgi:hypothetical protein
MNTEDLTALGTSPPFLFVSHKRSYARFPYVFEIIDHTHPVPSFIAIIQMIQPMTRKGITAEAVPGSPLNDGLTVLDSAGDAGF